eukprot:CAMPEP_0118971308 /NCGR_PEP_ID=MMETSP1173-20130426/7974_1 /TAXON_ID=1034831 /ORGANISM="Rhizochromulina marina cf, Strain CCMP1243" /LENGTH=53 /DNA_ID=CAMNT_0006920749 /DNA_START=3 /DNA_END=160 /DNA_ORIENTATION=+
MATTVSDAPRLSEAAKNHISGHAQRVAKVLAAQADAQVLRALVHEGGGNLGSA